jgi:hypothetical protein
LYLLRYLGDLREHWANIRNPIILFALAGVYFLPQFLYRRPLKPQGIRGSETVMLLYRKPHAHFHSRVREMVCPDLRFAYGQLIPQNEKFEKNPSRLRLTQSLTTVYGLAIAK